MDPITLSGLHLAAEVSIMFTISALVFIGIVAVAVLIKVELEVRREQRERHAAWKNHLLEVAREV